MNKMGIAIAFIIMFGFCLIMWATDAVGATFGKTGETIALIAVAVVLLIGFIKAKKESKSENELEKADDKPENSLK
jgi:uncharacterized membrane protein YhiD involved in acid resistance